MTGRGLWVNAARAAVLAVITAWTLFPIYYIVSLAVTPWTDLFRPVYWVAHPTLDNFKFVIFQESPFVKFFWRWLANSLWVSAATMAVVLVVVIMGDYDLLDTSWALIFAMTTFAAPYALWVLWDYAKTIPTEIDESAAIDGAGLVSVFFRIYLPLITPSLIAIGTYAFFYAWNEYLYAVLLLQGEKTITLPVGMGNFLTSDDAPWNLLMALSVIYAIPPVLFYYGVRRYLTHGLVSGSVAGA